MKIKTKYEIRNNRVHLKDGRILSICVDEKSALQSVWILEGRCKEKWFTLENGKVYEENSKININEL